MPVVVSKVNVVEPLECWRDRAYPLGASYDGSGTNFAVFSEVAERVELCLFDAEGTETRITLPEVDGFVWHGFCPVSSRVNATATAYTALTIRRRARRAIRTSCCSTRMPWPSTAHSNGINRCSATTSLTRIAATSTIRPSQCRVSSTMRLARCLCDGRYPHNRWPF
jgi:Carbohydrate-binding module 48 (Isoamylase N-terminal domain)